MVDYILGSGKYYFIDGGRLAIPKAGNLCRSYELDYVPGDLVVAYEKGFHVVERVIPRFLPTDEAVFTKFYQSYKQLGLGPGDEIAACVLYRCVYRFGTYAYVPNARIASCDAGYVKKITKEMLNAELTRISVGIQEMIAYITANQG